jgi:hypothetical protein
LFHRYPLWPSQHCCASGTAPQHQRFPPSGPQNDMMPEMSVAAEKRVSKKHSIGEEVACLMPELTVNADLRAPSRRPKLCIRASTSVDITPVLGPA